MCWLFTVVALVGACKGSDPRFTDAAVPRDADDPDAELIDAGIDAPIGHPGTGTVTGAVKASSPSYTLYGTLRSGDGSSSSPQYQRRGGITGATQP